MMYLLLIFLVAVGVVVAFVLGILGDHDKLPPWPKRDHAPAPVTSPRPLAYVPAQRGENGRHRRGGGQ